MKLFPFVLLLMTAFSVTAQEIVVPERSMRDAWDKDQQQFDSLSSEYESSLESDYGYPDTGPERGYEWRRPSDNSAPGDKSRESLPGEAGSDGTGQGGP